MKYTSEQINGMSWQEWNETMAKELNENGYKAQEYNSTEHRWTKTGMYKAGDDPKVFVLGTIEDSDAISFLKRSFSFWIFILFFKAFKYFSFVSVIFSIFAFCNKF